MNICFNTKFIFYIFSIRSKRKIFICLRANEYIAVYVNANKFAQRPGFHVISFIDYTANGLEEALINRGRHPFTNGAIYYQRLVKAQRLR